ncbi:MAG: hypothetical protein DRP15_00210 [Candidatus Aenigmatarchaeota archaeon]|nr:MAG: hypothetical protein DRP15_00210 [Candidatus Aenigmarchaeota archaeon]
MKEQNHNMMKQDKHILRSIDKLKEKIEFLEKENKKTIEELEARMISLENELRSLKDVENQMKTLDVKGLRRDLEALKARTEWLENFVNGFSIEPFMEKIHEIEATIQRVKALSPIVIE